jgi:hypothetical protein
MGTGMAMDTGTAVDMAAATVAVETVVVTVVVTARASVTAILAMAMTTSAAINNGAEEQDLLRKQHQDWAFRMMKTQSGSSGVACGAFSYKRP